MGTGHGSRKTDSSGWAGAAWALAGAAWVVAGAIVLVDGRSDRDLSAWARGAALIALGVLGLACTLCLARGQRVTRDQIADLRADLLSTSGALAVEVEAMRVRPPLAAMRRIAAGQLATAPVLVPAQRAGAPEPSGAMVDWWEGYRAACADLGEAAPPAEASTDD